MNFTMTVLASCLSGAGETALVTGTLATLPEAQIQTYMVVYNQVSVALVPGDPAPCSGLCSLGTHMMADMFRENT